MIQVTARQTNHLYETLVEDGVYSRSLAGYVSPSSLETLRRAELEYGQVRSYSVVATYAQILGTPSSSLVRVARRKGRFRETVEVDAIRPGSRVVDVTVVRDGD